ncbi:glutathione S-transferase family protein [Reyranella sp. CPCC 100927]|uniref:glutathione S-transferase family protein n=1 Tax=Reyranella sp. CPCC 100927 TaxID=2599616 RepID=UPI0011B72795|nr:glutathione S-transferase family protein [Reyranella sp. CPCC 100927]TWT01238.1 glutathione S-transferase family protein [Reyranella sp. CPCC 100927]
MTTLHGNADSGNCYKVRLALAQLGRSFTRIEYDTDHGATRTPGFLSKNPNGRVPVLELDDDTHLAESGAILWYLADGTDLLPNDRLERAQVLQWMFFEQYSHEPYIAVVRHWLKHHLLDAARTAQLAERQAKGHAALAVMETHLAIRPFFVASRYSIADIALYAYTHVAHEGGFDLSPYPHIIAWLERVRMQPRHVAIDAP